MRSPSRAKCHESGSRAWRRPARRPSSEGPTAGASGRPAPRGTTAAVPPIASSAPSRATQRPPRPASASCGRRRASATRGRRRAPSQARRRYRAARRESPTITISIHGRAAASITVWHAALAIKRPAATAASRTALVDVFCCVIEVAAAERWRRVMVERRRVESPLSRLQPQAARRSRRDCQFADRMRVAADESVSSTTEHRSTAHPRRPASIGHSSLASLPSRRPTSKRAASPNSARTRPSICWRSGKPSAPAEKASCEWATAITSQPRFSPTPDGCAPAPCRRA